jgi:vacuolar protein sorting-associated protein 54
MSRRLLADARYLHQKLSALKFIGTPSVMLETIIAEKRVLHAPPAPAALVPPLKGATIPGSQRLKERLANSLKSQGPLMEKATPAPVPTPVPPSGDVPNGHGERNMSPPPPPPPAAPEDSRPDPEGKASELGQPVGGTETLNQSAMDAQ